MSARDAIFSKARSLGADLVGIADFERVKEAPSHELFETIERHRGVGVPEDPDPEPSGFPPGAKSLVVIALRHPKSEPRLDWWDGRKGTPGNRLLIEICGNLASFIESELKIKTHKMPYYVEKGGVFLKDMAVYAGLGCIGKSNLLLTPEFGPRVRLRTLILEEELEPTGPVFYDPCDGCDQPCRKVCPQNAFGEPVFSPIETQMLTLPSRVGDYSRYLCNIQMEKDIEDAGIGNGKTSPDKSPVKYCRRCEFVCPAGSET